MKLSLSLTLLCSVLFTSCATKSKYNDQYTQEHPASSNPYSIPETTTTPYPTSPYEEYAGANNASSAPQVTNSQTSAPVNTPNYQSTASSHSYTVQKGDTLYGISRKHSTTVSALQKANNIVGSAIFAGQTIVIP